MAAEVERRHAERAAEDSHGLAEEPDREVAGDAVDQDDVGPGACLLVVKVDSVGDELGHGGYPPHSKVRFEECDELSDREIALGPAADLGDQLMKRERATVVFLKRFGEDDGVDRGEAQVGEEAGFLAERAAQGRRPSARRESR